MWASVVAVDELSGCGSRALEQRRHRVRLFCGTRGMDLLDQGLNPHLLHRQVDSLPLIPYHQESPHHIKFEVWVTIWLVLHDLLL